MTARLALTAQAVADLVGGRLVGDGAVVLRAVAPARPRRPGDALSFAVSARYLPTSSGRRRAGAVLVPDELAEAAGGPPTRIVVPDPYAAHGAGHGAAVPARRAAPARRRSDRAASAPAPCLAADVEHRALRGAGRGACARATGAGWARGVVLGDGVTVGDDSVHRTAAVVCYAGQPARAAGASSRPAR